MNHALCARLLPLPLPPMTSSRGAAAALAIGALLAAARPLAASEAAPAPKAPAAQERPVPELAHAPPAAQERPVGEPAPLLVKAVLDDPELRAARWLLPSRDASSVVTLSACEAGETTLRLFSVASATKRAQRIPGRVLALTWVDRTRVALVVAGAQETTLQLWDTAAERGQFVDSLPVARGEQSAACGLGSESHALWAGTDSGGISRLVLAVRRGAGRFELRRYALRPAEDGLAIGERATQALGGEGELGAVLPSLGPGPSLLLWREGAKGRQRLALAAQSGAGQPLAYVGGQLAGCSFAAGGQILCHSRSGAERGWLWSLRSTEERPRPQQITWSGQAAAYAVSPDGFKVAYVGTGGADGPLVVQDLVTGARRQLARLPDASDCASAVTWPRVFWSEPETLVVRGACSATYAVVAVSPPAVSAAPEPPPVSVVAPVAPRPPRARRTASATRAPSATSFWTPRY